MHVKVEAPWQRMLVLAAMLLAIGVYVDSITRTFLAAHAAACHSSNGFERALRWEPFNAEFQHQLGKYEFFTLGDEPTAVSHLRRAAELNPHEARYWLALAAAYQFEDDVEHQRDAIERAMQVDPTTPSLAWDAANFYFAQADHARAVELLRVVLAGTDDMGTAQRAADLCWRASDGDVRRMLEQILPASLNAHFAFLDLLIKRDNPTATESVWKHLIALRQPFDPRRAFPYIDSLLETRRIDDARQAWKELVEVNALQSYYEPDNLIANPGFDQDFMGGGFEWRMEHLPHVKLSFDGTEFRNGTRSLEIVFDGGQASGAGLTQLVPVEANTIYDFSANARWDDLLTSSGPRFVIADAYTKQQFVHTDDFLQSSVWREVHARFKTGPDTRLVSVSIVRDAEQTMIRGKLWIDSLRLSRSN
jgi:hypothetical protein